MQWQVQPTTEYWSVDDERYSAFTVSELGELLGHHVGGRSKFDRHPTEPYWCMEKKGSTEAEARARMLICEIECKLLREEKAKTWQS